MSLSVLLEQRNGVTVLEIDGARVDKINTKQSTVADIDIESFLANKELSLKATLNKQVAYDGASFIIVVTPTNCDTKTNSFDTSSVDNVIADALNLNGSALVIIKSTIPVGHTKSLQEKFETNRVFFGLNFCEKAKH